MENPTEELSNVLEDLKDEEFKKFKWIVKQSLPAAKLQHADRQDMVDILTETCGSIDDAIKETMTVLKKMDRNDLVKSLEELLEELELEDDEDEDDDDEDEDD